MNSSILVATDVVSDANLIRKLLREDFGDIAASSDRNRFVEDFETHRPSVLILAFKTLEQSERYYLTLYRLGSAVHGLPHRTLILCNQDDLRRVYELCKKEYFDDYVLFWPIPHDAVRLPMAVHHAQRQMAELENGAPSPSEFAAQARRLATLEALLAQSAARGGERIDDASRSLQQAQQGIGLALDGFSRGLAQGGLRGLVEVKDAPGLQREIDRLKAGEIGPRLDAVAAAVGPVRDWAGALRTEFVPQLESARALQMLAARVRPLVLLVDDDAYQHTLLRGLLRDEPLELLCAHSGEEALAALRRHRPSLILMDVELPDVDGVEVVRRIKASGAYSRVPVVMVTGRSGRRIVVESANAGASGFLVKPLNRETLLAKVRSCLES